MVRLVLLPPVQAESGGGTGHGWDNFFSRPRNRAGRFVHDTREVTQLLKAWSGGDPAALERLAEHVYPELRQMAGRYLKSERQANTLQATVLVHEVYLRQVDVTPG